MEFTEKQKWIGRQAIQEAEEEGYVALLLLDVHGWAKQVYNYAPLEEGKSLYEYPKFIMYTDIEERFLFLNVTEGYEKFGKDFYETDVGRAAWIYFRDAGYGFTSVELRPNSEIPEEYRHG